MGFLSNLFGGGSGAYNKTLNDLKTNKSQELNYWGTKAHSDYLNTSEAQAAIRQAREMLQQGTARADKRGVVSGATDESVALEKANNNQTLENVTANIAQNATAQKDQAMQNYLEATRQYTTAIDNVELQKDQAQTSALGGLLKAGINVAGSIIGGPVGGVVTSAVTKNM
jgi:multidrug resistance efflux pump